MHPALLTAIFLFSLLGHGYLWIALVNRLHGWAGPRRLIDVLTYACTAAFAMLPLLVAWQWWEWGSDFFTAKPANPLTHFALVYCLGCAMLGLGQLLAKFVRGFRDDDPQAVISKEQRFVGPPQTFPPDTLQGLYPRLLGWVPGNQALRLAVDTKRLALPRLPQQLDGLRIVHISDLHVTGRIGPAWFQHVADVVNSLNADVIMVTGDLVENEKCRAWLNDCLGKLRAQYGVYFVIGNHDLFIDAPRTVADLTSLGLIPMGGTSVLAQWNDYPVLIAGNELPWERRLADLSQPEHTHAMRPLRILLMHSPDQFDWACESDGDLALAGHTHGGQICFPILGAVAAPSLYGTRFAGGTFRRGNTVMHVTRGISGETPMRWRCPPEIAVLELVRSET